MGAFDVRRLIHSSVSPFHANGERLRLVIFAQFWAENRFALFPELL
jgi:hypothetical protein